MIGKYFFLVICNKWDNIDYCTSRSYYLEIIWFSICYHQLLFDWIIQWFFYGQIIWPIFGSVSLCKRSSRCGEFSISCSFVLAFIFDSTIPHWYNHIYNVFTCGHVCYKYILQFINLIDAKMLVVANVCVNWLWVKP